MTPDEYQIEALKTAVYSRVTAAQGAEYLTLALIGEVGEVCDARKKQMRMGNTDGSQDEYFNIAKQRIIDESGDVLWYMAMIAFECGVKFSLAVGVESLGGQAVGLYRSLAMLAKNAAKTADLVDSFGPERFMSEFAVGSLRSCFFYLSRVWMHYGITMDQVMKANVAKLANRKSTGTIKEHD